MILSGFHKIQQKSENRNAFFAIFLKVARLRSWRHEMQIISRNHLLIAADFFCATCISWNKKSHPEKETLKRFIFFRLNCLTLIENYFENISKNCQNNFSVNLKIFSRISRKRFFFAHSSAMQEFQWNLCNVKYRWPSCPTFQIYPKWRWF